MMEIAHKVIRINEITHNATIINGINNTLLIHKPVIYNYSSIRQEYIFTQK